ncbi:hypothetical protein HZU77_015250 [Neisseriaceae bacterium TC5R-5]|nr:hypothetical protein [Neisseriaceae bacterium TC5R-5]
MMKSLPPLLLTLSLLTPSSWAVDVAPVNANSVMIECLPSAPSGEDMRDWLLNRLVLRGLNVNTEPAQWGLCFRQGQGQQFVATPGWGGPPRWSVGVGRYWDNGGIGWNAPIYDIRTIQTISLSITHKQDGKQLWQGERTVNSQGNQRQQLELAIRSLIDSMPLP